MRVGWIAAEYNDLHAAYRFRVKMPMDCLSAIGHTQEIFDPDRWSTYDVVVFGRAYQDAHIVMAQSLRDKGVPTALDLSDNHFYNPYRLPQYTQGARRLLRMITTVDLVICTTSALAAAVRDALGERVPPLHVVGDYCERVKCSPCHGDTGQRMLLWFGNAGSANAPNGLSDLNLIVEPLQRAYEQCKFKLVVSSGDPVRHALEVAGSGFPSSHVTWTRTGFPNLLAAADAVVIPATRNPFVDAKSPNRLTLSLLADVPVVATGIPSYREFAEYCYLDCWDTGLEEVLQRPAVSRARAAAGAAYIRREWSDERVTEDWVRALAATAAMSRRPVV